MMMKKLLILMLVLGMASSANAVIITFDSPSGPDVLPGATVLVQLTSDTAVAVGYLVSITESTTSAAGHSTAAMGTLNAGFDDDGVNNTGNLRNGMTTFGAGAPRHMLIDRTVGGILGASPAIAAGQVLYQFELQIPANAVFCDTWTIDAALGFPVVSPPPAGYSHMADAVIIAGTNALTIHAIPEPATIALLGLGGLSLLRRRRK